MECIESTAGHGHPTHAARLYWKTTDASFGIGKFPQPEGSGSWGPSFEPEKGNRGKVEPWETSEPWESMSTFANTPVCCYAFHLSRSLRSYCCHSTPCASCSKASTTLWMFLFLSTMLDLSPLSRPPSSLCILVCRKPL